MHTRFLVAAIGTALVSSTSNAQTVLVPESSNDTVMQFDANDGSLVNAAYVDIATATAGAAGTPIEVLFPANGELWITDQLADVVFRFSGDGSTFLGQSTAMLDNMRGGALFGGNVIVANSGAGNGAPDDALVELDPTGAGLSATPIGDPFDAEPIVLNGVPGYLVSDIAGEDLVFAEAANLANQTIFHDSDGVTGIDFPEQIHVSATGRIWAAGFSAPSGIYEYDSTGAELQYIDTSALGFGGLRGVFELGNGNLMFTNGSGVHVYDVASGTVSTTMAGVSGRFIKLDGGGSTGIGTNYCTANANSTGNGAVMSAAGSDIVANNNLELRCGQMPTNSFAFFLTSQVQGFVANPGGSAGNLCLSGAIGRFVGPGQVQNSGAAGSVALMTDLTQQPTPTGLVQVNAGESWNYQCWFRDAVGGQATSNFSDGLEITFQ